MKKTVCILLSIILSVGLSTLPVNVYADGPEPSTSVNAKNVAFQDSLYLLFYAGFNDVPQGAETGVMVWNNSDYARDCENSCEYAVKCERTGFTHLTYGEEFIFKNLTAKNMADDFYVRSYIKDGGRYTFSPMIKYSVLQYAYNRLAVSEDENFKALLSKVLDYGAAAQIYFNYRTDRLANGTYYAVSLVGGTFEDGTSGGLFQSGDTPAIYADAVDGAKFSHWQDSNGTVIGSKENIEAEVTGNDTFTAVSTNTVVADEGCKAEYAVKGKVAAIAVKDGDGRPVSPKNVTIMYPDRLNKAGAEIAEIDFCGSFVLELDISAATGGLFDKPIAAEYEEQTVTVKYGGTTLFEADLSPIADRTARLIYDGKTVKALDTDGRILEEFEPVN